MFDRLIRKIFKKVAPPPKPQFNPQLEAQKQRIAEAKHNAKVDQQFVIASQKLNELQYLFYEYLLGESEDKATINELERRILVDLNKAIAKPDLIIQQFPPIPKSVSELISVLGTDDFDLNKFISIVEQDPVVATELIKVANSSLFNVGGNNVTDI